MKYYTTKLNRIPRILALAVAMAAALVASGVVRQAAAQQYSVRPKLNKFAQQGSNNAANTLFNGGRDLIDDAQWAKAEENFAQYLSAYPSEKNLDAAMYWMAYSQYKLRKFNQSKETIDRLLKTYEKTTWKEDAELLLAQLPGAVTVKAQERMQERMKDAQERIKDKTVFKYDFDFDFGKGKGSTDDDPCEFKIVVLQALFESDPQRGMAVATDWLKPNSGQTVTCKRAALRLLARHGGKAVTSTILGIAQGNDDVKLRAAAISLLGSTNDDSVIDPLRDFALNSTQNEIAEAALFALSQNTGARAASVLADIALSNKPVPLRRTAISHIANRQGEPAVDALFKVIRGLGQRKSERAGARLLEIARSSDNVELRKAAISAFGRRGGQPAVDALMALYGSEKNEEIKDQIMNSLAYSNDPKVTHMLITIAKNPQTPIERRRRIIMILAGHSKDPEVIAFLEDLLKQ